MPTLAGDWVTVCFILAGALAGGFVNGLTGFGTALTALPLWLQVLEPLIAAQVASACSVAGHTMSLPAIWGAIDWRRVAPMLIAGLIGVPIGTRILPLISLPTFKLGVGIVLIAYCAFRLIATGRMRLKAGGRGAEIVVGFAGGVLGGIAALSGALPTVWATLKGWPKQEQRMVFQTFNMSMLTAMLLASAVQGQVSRASLLAVCIAAPATLAGAWLGVRLYHRLDDYRFDRIVLAVLMLSGVGLVWSTL